jgi:hypothetical protein
VIQNINRNPDKNHIVISGDIHKAFEKFQHSFLIKALKKVGIEGIYSALKRLYRTSL